jgi:arylsulfatase A-like enzyme
MLFSGAGIRQGIIVEEPVAIIDVSPTISYLLDVRQPADSQGRILEEAIARHR